MDSTSTTKADVPLWYTDMVTLRQERPEFDEACDVTIDNFQSIVAKTDMREDLTCQLRHAVDGRCNQPHQHGWLAKRKDGKEGLIGGVCADKHFQANERYRTERHRINKEIAIANHLAALGELLTDRSAFRARAQQLRERLDGARAAQRAFQQSLPIEVQSELLSMGRSGSRRVEVEIEYIEREKGGKETRSWQRRDVGAIQGAVLWLPIGLDIAARLAAIVAAARDAILDRKQSEASLRKWREALEQMPHCEEDITKIERDIEGFSTPTNLGMLCHLVANQNKQREIAALIMKRNGNASPREVEIQMLLNQIQKRVRDQYGGRNFRVIY